MKGFIITVIAVAVLGGIMGMLSPEGDTKKYVRFVGSLCLLCALVTPVYGILSEGQVGLDDLFPFSEETDSGYEEIYMNALLEGARENAEAEVKRQLCEEMELSDGSLDVSLDIRNDGGKYSVVSATVSLHSSAVFADPREISAFVNELCGCPCSVIYS